MKVSLIIIIVLSFCFCNQSKHSTITKTYKIPEIDYTLIQYHVIMIDSIKDVYLISVKKDDIIYKIISYKKETNTPFGEKIKIGRTYNFDLSPLLLLIYGHGIITDKALKDYSKINNRDTTIKYDNLNITLEKGSKYNLYKARQLDGLYFY